MRFPLKFAVHELMKAQKSATDDELLTALNKNGNKCSLNEFNKALMQLEIIGLVSVRWIGKDKRRVEVLEPGTDEASRRLGRIAE